MTEPTEVLDGDIVADQPELAPHVDTPTADVAPASTAVARRERRSEVIRPLNADDLIESFSAYQDLLPKLLDSSDYQDAGRGKRFVKKSGWRKIATAFDLDVQIIRSVVDRDDDGHPLRAEVWARAIAPSGRSMDGDGYCSIDEERFSGPRGNKSKVENDLRATATTRAMNRAISGLVGMGEVSAEEINASGQDHSGPPHGPQAGGDLVTAASTALLWLCGNDADVARDRWGQLKKELGGYLPHGAALALVVAAGHAPTDAPA